MAITDRREIEFDLQAIRFALQCSPRSAQAFGLPPLMPQAAQCNPTDGTLEVTYGELTSTRVFKLRAEALGAILIAYCNRIGMPMPRVARAFGSSWIRTAYFCEPKTWTWATPEIVEIFWAIIVSPYSSSCESGSEGEVNTANQFILADFIEESALMQSVEQAEAHPLVVACAADYVA